MLSIPRRFTTTSLARISNIAPRSVIPAKAGIQNPPISERSDLRNSVFNPTLPSHLKIPLFANFPLPHIPLPCYPSPMKILASTPHFPGPYPILRRIRDSQIPPIFSGNESRCPNHPISRLKSPILTLTRLYKRVATTPADSKTSHSFQHSFCIRSITIPTATFTGSATSNTRGRRRPPSLL